MQYFEENVSCINCNLFYSRVHGQIHLAAQFTSGVLWHFHFAPWKVGFLVLKGQKWDPHVTPKLKVREVAFEISYHTQLLCQVSAKSVDHNVWPLEHFLRQWHLKVLVVSVVGKQTWRFCGSLYARIHLSTLQNFDQSVTSLLLERDQKRDLACVQTLPPLQKRAGRETSMKCWR